MVEATNAALKTAELRGLEMLETEPRAESASYDPATGRVTVELYNGCAYVFPSERIEDLQEARPEDLAKVDVDGMGFNLHWPTLDVDLFVPALVSGLFGTRRWMDRELAGAAGQKQSAAKVTPAGARRGRPRKVAKG